MKTVHLFDDFFQLAGSDRQARAYRSGKILYSLATKTAGKINPATVWVDAALSCIDAINSYLRLQRAREVTKQLEMMKSSLEEQLKNHQNIIQLYLDDIRESKEHRLNEIGKIFELESEKCKLLIDMVVKNKEEIFKSSRSISNLRHSGGYSKELSQLLRVTDELVFATLNMINNKAG
jgi:hypothetical protein